MRAGHPLMPAAVGSRNSPLLPRFWVSHGLSRRVHKVGDTRAAAATLLHGEAGIWRARLVLCPPGKQKVPAKVALSEMGHV